MRNFYLLTIIALLTFLSACKKDTSIGADILPSTDLLNVKFSDTFSINAKTLADTFLRSDKLSRNYLGVINDTKFGFQKASLVMELDKPTTVYDDTLGPFTVDSVVLFLDYGLVYGDTTLAQNFKVSTISNKIIESNAYYSNTTAFPASTLIGSASNYRFTPTTNPVHTTISDTVGTTGILRIKLNSFVGYSILNLGQTILRDSAQFKNAFPGIVIENSDNTGRAMVEISSASTNTGMVIFYKDKYGVSKNLKSYASLYTIANGSLSTRLNGINLFSNSLSSTVQNTINSGALSDSVNYILGQGGTLVKVSLPTLGTIGKAAVNKATITVTQIEISSLPEYQVPYFMLLLKRNSSGNLDILSSGDGAGIIDSTGTDALGNKISRYTFNITKYVQDISFGKETNDDLYIATYRSGGTVGPVNTLNSIVNGTSINFGYTPSRVVIAGPNYSDARYKMKLNVTYSLIK